MTIIPANTLTDAAFIARSRGIPKDQWAWAASLSIARRWQAAAFARGVTVSIAPMLTLDEYRAQLEAAA